jgi:hypothetical protein
MIITIMIKLADKIFGMDLTDTGIMVAVVCEAIIEVLVMAAALKILFSSKL